MLEFLKTHRHHRRNGKQPSTDMFLELNKGHVVTKKELAPRPCARKEKTSKRLLGLHFAPYEMLKVEKDKTALKVTNRKLGSWNPQTCKEEISFVYLCYGFTCYLVFPCFNFLKFLLLLLEEMCFISHVSLCALFLCITRYQKFLWVY